MFKFIYDSEEDNRIVEHTFDVMTWPEVVAQFNYFLAGCGYIAHDNKQDYPFCEPKDDHLCKLDSFSD